MEKKHHVKTLEALFVYPPKKKKGDIHLAMLAKSSPIFACCIGNTSDLLAIFTWVHLTDPNKSKGTSHRVMLIHDSHPPKFKTSPLKSYRAPRSERILLKKKNIVFQGRTVWVCIQWTPSNPFHQGCVLSSPSTWQCPASWWPQELAEKWIHPRSLTYENDGWKTILSSWDSKFSEANLKLPGCTPKNYSGHPNYSVQISSIDWTWSRNKQLTLGYHW